MGGSLPGESKEPVELGLGLPRHGLWLREDVDMRCNVFMTGFVKKTLKKAHSSLVARLVQKAHLVEAQSLNARLSQSGLSNTFCAPPSFKPGDLSTSSYSDVSSLRSSRESQSPGFQQDEFASAPSLSQLPLDPLYRNGQDSHLLPQHHFMGDQPYRHAVSPPMLYQSYTAELPDQKTPIHATPSELPTSISPQHYELPARFYDEHQ